MAILITGALSLGSSSGDSEDCNTLAYFATGIGAVVTIALIFEWIVVCLVMCRCLQFGDPCGAPRIARAVVSTVMLGAVFVGTGAGSYLFLADHVEEESSGCDLHTRRSFFGFFILCMVAVIGCGCCVPCLECFFKFMDDGDLDDCNCCEAFMCNSYVHVAAGFDWNDGSSSDYRVNYGHYLGRAANVVGMGQLVPGAAGVEGAADGGAGARRRGGGGGGGGGAAAARDSGGVGLRAGAGDAPV